MALSQLNLPERQVPIRVTLADQTRQSLDEIRLLPVAGTDGNVTFAAIAEVAMGSSPSEINRLDRSRNVSVTIALNGRGLSDVNSEVAQLSSYQNLHSGVTLVEQGDIKQQSELFTNFATAMVLGIFCGYAVLVLLFDDFPQPVTILTALPLTLGGALFPLVIASTRFSMPAMIGLLLLMGIVEDLDPADRLCAGGAQGRHGPLRCVGGCLPQAGTPDCHDHGCDVSRHAACGT